ncbi:hypothetical protein TRIUR3_35183 [Triticum urartu]|uniref:Uncharacterized protein n=1 Tax=Triticum urartu TaxID=4572 RepID=M7YIX7_TRIUA|nr:hypothetical protein TRIUR3_35183 [Triticum urartu]
MDELQAMADAGGTGPSQTGIDGGTGTGRQGVCVLQIDGGTGTGRQALEYYKLPGKSIEVGDDLKMRKTKDLIKIER